MKGAASEISAPQDRSCSGGHGSHARLHRRHRGRRRGRTSHIALLLSLRPANAPGLALMHAGLESSRFARLCCRSSGNLSRPDGRRIAQPASRVAIQRAAVALARRRTAENSTSRESDRSTFLHGDCQTADTHGYNSSNLFHICLAPYKIA